MVMWAHVVTAVGSIAATLTVVHLIPGTEVMQSEQQKRHAQRVTPVGYENTIMPQGPCNISSVDGLKANFPNPDFPNFLSTAINPNYGIHVVVTARDGKLYHKHQSHPGHDGNFSDWKCITPDTTKIPCMIAPKCIGYDSTPAMIWQPKNGTLVVFVRSLDDLDVHEMHLQDPKDPDSWSPMRAPACLCNFPPCVDKGQTKCGARAHCDNQGVDCGNAAHNSSLPKYWNSRAIFPTSELQLVADVDDLINMFYRGFDGNLYGLKQHNAGESNGKYGVPVQVAPNAIFE